MFRSEFLAKRPRRDAPAPTVAEHNESVSVSGQKILELIDSDLIRWMQLDTSTAENLDAALTACGLLHDFIKVNSAFQAMLRSRPGDAERQPVRHEILAAWLLADPDFFGRWFSRGQRDQDAWPIIWAIAGHHLKMHDPARGKVLFDTGSGTRTLEIPLEASEVKHLISEAAKAMKTAEPPPSVTNIVFETVDDSDGGLEQRICGFVKTSCRMWHRLRRDPRVVQRTALLKALLISADVAASAVVADGRCPSEWISAALRVRLSPDSLTPIIQKGTKGKELLDFQKQVGASKKPATIVVAGCGNGKTTAAYLWGQRNAVGRKLWFTYPTTGTASAGYQGYLYDHPDLLSTLMHGRAEVDLQAIRGTPEDDPDEEALQLESLRAWDRQAIVCTVDT